MQDFPISALGGYADAVTLVPIPSCAGGKKRRGYQQRQPRPHHRALGMRRPRARARPPGTAGMVKAKVQARQRDIGSSYH